MREIVVLIRIIIISAIIFTLGMVLYAGQPWKLDGIEIVLSLASFIGFGAFSILPYGLLLKSFGKNYSSDIKLTVLSVGACGILMIGGAQLSGSSCLCFRDITSCMLSILQV